MYKDNPEDMEKYTDCAVWCNANNATIEDRGDYYEVVEIEEVLPTLEEQIRQLESDYETAKHEICKYYMDAIIEGDVDTQKDLQAELQALQEQYSADVTAVMNTNVDENEEI